MSRRRAEAGTGTAEEEERAWEERPSADAWRGGGIMTGEMELPGRGRSGAGGEVEQASVGTEWERAGGRAAPGVTKPTCRTLGSMTVRGARRRSMERVASAAVEERGQGNDGHRGLEEEVEELASSINKTGGRGGGEFRVWKEVGLEPDNFAWRPARPAHRY